MTKASISKTKITFLLFFALAFSLRCLYFKQTAGYIQPGSGSDSYFYLQWAKDIIRGNIIGKDVFYALPGYPYFLSLAYLFSGGEVFGLILIQLVLGSINCGLIYLLAKRLFNEQVGIIAGIIACGYSMFIFYDRMLLPASLAIFLGLSVILLLLKIKARPNSKIWFGLGLLLGLCTLSSAGFSLLAIVIFFWIIYEFKERPFKKLLAYAFSFILAFLLIIGGTSLRNYLVAKDAVFITAHSGINFYIGNNAQANGLFRTPPFMRPTQSGLMEDARIIAEKMSARGLKASEVSNFWFRRSLDFIRRSPLAYLKLLGRKFVLFCNGKEHVDDIEYYIFNEKARLFQFSLFRFSLISPLALLGIFLSWPKAKRIAPLYLFVFSFMLATISFFINSRYRLMALPYLIIFASYAFWQILQQFQNKRFKGLILSLVLFCALCLLTNLKIESVFASRNYSFHYNKGVYLSDQGRYQQAQEEFQLALEINPFDFMSYLGLGNVYYQIEDFPQAIKSYKKSLAINPYFYKPYFNLGMLYEETGVYKEAKEEFKKVLELKPKDCAGHYNLGKVYEKEGLVELALREYERALKIQPGHREVLQAIEEIKRNNQYEKEE